jgi:hypothetical protein
VAARWWMSGCRVARLRSLRSSSVIFFYALGLF